VTMGRGRSLPFVPGRKREDWDLPLRLGGPAPERVRAIREPIRGRVERLIAARGNPERSGV